MIRTIPVHLIFTLALVFTGFAGEKIRVGMPETIFAGLNPGDAKLTMIQIMEMAGFGKQEIDVRLYANASEFVAALRAEEVDFFPLSSLDFVRLEQDLEVEPVAINQSEGKDPRSSLLLLTSRESTDLRDFVGGSLIIDRSHSFGLDRIWLESLLMESGFGSPEETFGSVTWVDKPGRALLPAFFGKCDLCLATRRDWEVLAELNPQLSHRLKPAAESGKLIMAVLAFRKGYDSARMKRFVDDLTHLHETPAGKQVLTITKTERIINYRPEYLEETRQLILRHAELTQRKEAK